MQRRPGAHSLLSPATYRVLRTFLTAEGPLTQLEAARIAQASTAQTSRVVRWLMAHGHAERQPDGRYRARGAAGLVASALPYQRVMADSLYAVLRLRATPEDISRRICDASGVLCLETALASYSRFFRADRVAAYHSDPESLVRMLRAEEGGLLPVAVYWPDLALDGDIVDLPESPGLRATSRFRTVLDLSCDGKVYAAKEVLEELWGVVIG
jgi:hypothetical protein